MYFHLIFNFKEPAKLRKSKWDKEEVKAVELHMMKFILTCTVPGKKDCVLCLEAEPNSLKSRTWTAIKNYVRNRITSLKLKTSS